MALYWRSPYKEPRNGCSQSEVRDTSRSLRSVKSATSRFSDPISPQDWFDASMGFVRAGSTSSSFRRAGAIKGILKEPPQYGECRLGPQASLNSSSVEELAPVRKSKKKVTFGGDNADIGDPHQDFQASRTVSAHQIRLMNRAPLDEFARQNLRKLLGYAPAVSSLPSLSGKSMLPVPEQPSPPPSAGSNRARLATPPAELSGKVTPRHTPTNYLDMAKRNSLDLSIDGLVASSQEQMKQNSEEHRQTNHELPEEEPTKNLKRHWTKSFARSSERRRSCRQLTGRQPMSASVLQRNLTFRRAAHDKTVVGGDSMTQDFLKLRITGGGTMVGRKSSPTDREPKASTTWPAGGQGSARGDAQGLRGTRLPATVTQLPEPPQSPKHVPTTQAVHVKYGSSRLDSRSSSFREHPLDKTAQILSWLQDVKQKEGFTPRNSRLYALELQQQH